MKPYATNWKWYTVKGVKSSTRGDGLQHLVVYMSHNGAKDYFPTKIYVRPADFNENTGRVKPRHPNHTEINDRLGTIEIELEALSIKHRDKSIKEIFTLYKNGYTTKTKEKIPDLLEFITIVRERIRLGKEINARTGLPLKDNTAKGYSNLHTHLKVFCERIRWVGYEDINQEFYEDFLYFLRNTYHLYSGDPQPLAENTVGTDIKNLKAVMGRAREKKYTSNDSDKNFVAIEVPVTRIKLEPEEVDMIIAIDLKEHPHLQEERDRWLCAYNFLLRHNDSLDITEGNIIQNKSGQFMETIPGKTERKVLVPIMKCVWDIMTRNNGRVPALTNQESNWKIKEICRLAGINSKTAIYEYRAGRRIKTVYEKWEVVDSHTARRSGARNMKRAGIPLDIIMILGGWKTLKEFFKYIGEEEMDAAIIASQYPFFNK